MLYTFIILQEDVEYQTSKLVLAGRWVISVSLAASFLVPEILHLAKSYNASSLRVSTLLLTPICPHTCDHIWRDILRKHGSALKAGWPQLPPPDAGLQRQAAYIEKLRDRLASIISKETQVKKQKKGQISGPPIKVSCKLSR